MKRLEDEEIGRVKRDGFLIIEILLQIFFPSDLGLQNAFPSVQISDLHILCENRASCCKVPLRKI